MKKRWQEWRRDPERREHRAVEKQKAIERAQVLFGLQSKTVVTEGPCFSLLKSRVESLRS